MPGVSGHGRLAIWAAATAICAVPCGSASWAREAAVGPATRRPNVLLITVDTLRRDALGWIAGAAGNGAAMAVDTPHLDALAAEGFRLPDAVTPVPITLPAHSSILTGLLPRRHGVRDNGQLLAAGVPSLAEKLRDRGYRTAAFVSGFPLASTFGLDRGFEHYDDELPEGQEGWLERRAGDTTAAALA